MLAKHALNVRRCFSIPLLLVHSALTILALKHEVSSQREFRTFWTKHPTWPSQMANPHTSAQDHQPYKIASEIVHYDPSCIHLNSASLLKRNPYWPEVSPPH